jgi:hypothetical protein
MPSPEKLLADAHSQIFYSMHIPPLAALAICAQIDLARKLLDQLKDPTQCEL